MTLKGENQKNKGIEILINNYPKDFIPKYFKVLIEDTAGMGKSTISKKLFLSVIRQNAGIPVLIELSQINRKNSILKELQNQISPIGKKISQDFLVKFINEGEFIFLFDGFDEISLKNREYVIKELHRFIEKANNNYFLITSRPEDSLVSFGGFKKFTVKPLEKGDAYSLLSKYDEYSYKPISKKLIKQLNNKPKDTLQEYLTNPFLVSLLYKSYEFKKDIPIKKSQFYQQVYDALFETHDLSKEGYLRRDKYSNLHIDDFERVLRYIGYFSSIDNRVEYDKNGIVKYINKAKNHLTDLSFKPNDFLKDLLKTVPLFKKEGNYYKWGHKSLQDYFAAKFLWIDAKEKQEKILLKIYQDPRNKRFYNLLDLFFELDHQTFEKTLVKWLLDDFFEYANNNYCYCNKSEFKKRIENHFNKKCSIAIVKKEEYSTKDNHKIRSYYSSKIKHTFDHTTFHYYESPKTIVYTFIDYEARLGTIIGLLSNRMPELAEFRIHNHRKKELLLLEEGNIYILDEKETNVLNNPIIFDMTSELIKSDFALKYDSALIKYNQLKAKSNNYIESEFLDW